MPMHRKNKGRSRPAGQGYEVWFFPNRRRNRVRNWLSLKSRRANRRKKKGK